MEKVTRPLKASKPLLEWGAAQMALPGQTESGDRLLVKTVSNGVLAAVVDGLGHGLGAAEAAKIAVSTLENYAEESVISLMRRCDENLKRTRGVVMSLALFNGADDTMTWMGVGNVEGMLVRSDSNVGMRHEFLLLRGGVVGGGLPALQAAIMPVMPGDTLIFTTDGIRAGFDQKVDLSDSPQRIADQILVGYRWGTDDALVLVARYLGRGNGRQAA